MGPWRKKPLELFAKNAFFGHFGDFQPGYEPN